MYHRSIPVKLKSAGGKDAILKFVGSTVKKSMILTLQLGILVVSVHSKFHNNLLKVTLHSIKYTRRKVGSLLHSRF